MKITFATEYIGKKKGKGGVERVLSKLANELSERGHEVTIFCTDVNSRDEFMYPVLPQVQYCNLLEAASNDFIDRVKFKLVKNFIDYKWEFYIAINRLLKNLLPFFEKDHQRPNKQSSSPSDNKKPSGLAQYISRWNWKLDKIFYNYVLNYPKLMKKNNPDVFILFGGLDFFLFGGLYFLLYTLLSKEKDFPIIYSFRNTVSVDFERISRRPNPYSLVRFNKLLESVDAILVQLPEFINELPKPLQNKTLSISNPIDQVDKHKRADPELNTELKTILVVGRLEQPQKNHSVLLDAFANLSPKHPDWQVKIFGEGRLREKLTDQIQKLKLTDKVFLMGVTDAINEEYRKAHILAMPSKYEGFSNVLGEAMAHGLPAVGFDNANGVNFLIKHGYNGLLADGKSPVDGLTLCLEQLMTNPKLRAELGQNGVESMKLYDPEKIYDLWEKTILDVKHNFYKSRL